jgi:hypothetical protein
MTENLAGKVLLTSSKQSLTEIAVTAFWVVAGIVSVLAAWTGGRTRRSDFQMMWTSAHLWRSGTDPYSGVVAGADLNPPVVVWILTPLAWFSPPVAFVLWTLFGWTCLAIAAWLIARESGAASGLTIMAAVLVTAGGTMATASGQLTWPLLLLVTLAWLADRHDRARGAGALIGLMAAVKLFFGLWLVDLLLRRAGRALAFAAGGVLVACLIGLAVHGPAGYASWLDALRRVTWAGRETNASLFGFWTRELSPARARLSWLVSAAIVAAAGLSVSWRAPDPDIRWATLMISALLVSPLGWVYYVPLAIGPLWVLHGRGSLRKVDAVLYAAWCIPSAVPYAPASAGWHMVWINRYSFALFALWIRIIGQGCWGR